ncbi:hypothetical protein ACMA1I_13940 [Pontibacter sp. 13R65]|uniref:hypothetical protein n=1 Tax=Pontibacter sp. 13R65 TaxID=3127458 RepID=UPI00301C2AD1
MGISLSLSLFGRNLIRQVAHRRSCTTETHHSRRRKFVRYALYPLLVAFMVVAFGCKEKDVSPTEEVLAQLAGRCLQGKVITGSMCTSGVYVQLLNAETGTTSTFERKEFRNIILVGNFPESADLGPDKSNSFWFTIDGSNGFDNCTEYYPCQMHLDYTLLEPFPVTIKACIKSFSTSSCPVENED